MPRRFLLVASILSLISLASCQQSTPIPPAFPTLAPAPTASPAVPANGATSAPASTAIIAAPSATAASNSTPLAISAMRAKAYPGSSLTVEQTLPPGPNFSRSIVSYQSDGLKLYGLLTVPTGNPPAGGWPVILLNHGYIPPTEYSTAQSYAGIDAPLAEAGYVVFKPDYRGHGNSPGTPCQIYICPDYVTDSLNALASVKRLPGVNPDKIAVWGHSMGGNITLHELVISGDIKAAVIMAGVVGSYSDILDWWKARVANGVLTTSNDLETNQLVDQMVAQHGTPQTNRDYWNPMDPTQFLSDVQAPVLIQVGTADTVVPPSFSQNLAAQLKVAGKNVTLHVYPGADHNLSPDTAAAVQEAIAFFNQYLK